MKIEVLYSDGCQGYEALVPRLRELLAQLGVDAPVELTSIGSAEAAHEARFLGSPTLRINGEDLEPSAESRTDYGLKCRLYPRRDGLQGMVPDELIVAGIARHRISRR